MKRSTIFKMIFYDDITRFDSLTSYASFRTVAKLRCKMSMDKLYDKCIPSSSTCYLNLEQINLIEKAVSSYINFTEYSFL